MGRSAVVGRGRQHRDEVSPNDGDFNCAYAAVDPVQLPAIRGSRIGRQDECGLLGASGSAAGTL
jgi:hypothetical protein